MQITSTASFGGQTEPTTSCTHTTTERLTTQSVKYDGSLSKFCSMLSLRFLRSVWLSDCCFLHRQTLQNGDKNSRPEVVFFLMWVLVQLFFKASTDLQLLSWEQLMVPWWRSHPVKRPQYLLRDKEQREITHSPMDFSWCVWEGEKKAAPWLLCACSGVGLLVGEAVCVWIEEERGGWKAGQGGAFRASQGEPSATVHSAPEVV